MTTEGALFWAGIGFLIEFTGHALYSFIKRKIREHERIVNEKILRGIK